MVGRTKDAAEETEDGVEALLRGLRSDSALRVFLASDFSPEKHTGNAVREGRVDAALADAVRAASMLRARVREEVVERKDALLGEVEKVAVLEREVAGVGAGVDALRGACEAVEDAMKAPFLPMEVAVRRMRNMCQASDLLRAVARFGVCVGKLKDVGLYPTVSAGAPSTPAGLPAAAEALKELEDLTGPQGPQGLEKVEGMAKAIVAVRKAAPELRKRAAATLKQGLADRNQIAVEAAVSAFNSLRVLSDRVNAEVARLLSETQAALHRGLEAPRGAKLTAMKGRGAVSSGSGGGPPGHADVWVNVDKMLDGVADACCKAVLLQQVLSRKYCDATHMSLLHEPIASAFIDSVGRSLAEQVAMLARTRNQRPAAAYVFLALAEGYPRLRSSLSSLASRIDALARVSPTPITPLTSTAKVPLVPDHAYINSVFLTAVIDVETHYLTASLERLTASVTAAFNDGSKQPGETEALSFAKLLASELSAARGDKVLSHTAISNVSTALRLYTSHAEDYAAANAPDAAAHRSATRSATGGVSEWHLTRLYNGMVTLHTSANRVLGAGEDGSGPLPPPIAKEVTGLAKLADLLLDGLFAQFRANIGTVLQRMHTEDLTGDVGDDGCSVYIMDIAAQLSMFAEGVISGLARSRSLGAFTLKLARWVLDSFVRHISLVFPLSEAVKMRLSTDMARLELAVESLCAARMLGSSYRALRAIRSVMLLPTDALAVISEDDAVLFDDLQALGPSAVARHLLSRCSHEHLQHPHRRQNTTPALYVSWLETHSESDAWEAVEESLQAYSKDGTAASVTTDAPEYAAIMNVCPRLQRAVEIAAKEASEW